MSYILTIYLLMSGHLIGADVLLPGDVDCARTATAIAVDNQGVLIDFTCTLQIEV